MPKGAHLKKLVVANKLKRASLLNTTSQQSFDAVVSYLHACFAVILRPSLEYYWLFSFIFGVFIVFQTENQDDR